MEDNPKANQIEVNTNTHIGSKYAQIVGITVADDNTVTLDFAYVHPREGKGVIVSRITLPKKTAEELSSLIQMTIKMHENKKKGLKDD